MSQNLDDGDDDRDRLYDVLNVSRTSTLTDIRESHRRLSRLFHPDKHTSSQSQANVRFQEIQHAFEVLSDARSRSIYDTLGEAGLDAKLDVGRRNMTPEELKAFFFNQSRQVKVEELDSLVQTRGETSISVDCRSMFGGRVVIEQHTRVGSPVPFRVARPATWGERAADVTFRGMSLRNSWTIPFSFSTLLNDEDSALQPQIVDNTSALTLTSHANITGMRQMAGFGVLASLRHQISPKWSLEASLPLLSPRVFRSKVIHQYSPDVFVTVDMSSSTLAYPPDITVTGGRQMTPRGVFFGTLRSGTPWKLAGWGQYGNAASYIIGWTQNAVPLDPTGYTLELITGLQVLGVAADYNTLFKSSDIRMKIGGSATTSGVAMTVTANRKITQHSRIGAHVTANSRNLILRLTFSRFGQNFKLPIWIGDGMDIDSILYGILLPLGGLIAYELGVVQPRRKKRKARSIQHKKEQLRDKLIEMERSAKESVDLMSEAVARKQEQARSQSDLYLASATYGTKDRRIDVTIALAAQINDNQLVLANNHRKSGLLGFWDPAYGEKKTLRVDYQYDGRRHFIEVGDKDGLAIPSRTHST